MPEKGGGGAASPVRWPPLAVIRGDSDCLNRFSADIMGSYTHYPLQKEPFPPESTSIWFFTAVDADGARVPIASCFAMASPGVDAKCSAFGRYGSLVYSFSFDAEDIDQIDVHRRDIESLLAAWERD